MKVKSFYVTATTLALIMSTNISAEEFVVGQKDKGFTQAEMTIKAGDVVKFTNEDPFSHNVYSLSDVKSFDLGSYPKGDSRSVTFDQPGVIEVGCAVHMDMSLIIKVE